MECIVILTFLAARMLVLEFRQIVDVLIHYNPEIVGFVVRRYVGSRESL